jgi:hypothetical protein
MDQEERLGGKMNRLELTKALADASISDQSVRFSDANDHYCLVKKGDAWVVYFIERGEEMYFDLLAQNMKPVCIFMRF